MREREIYYIYIHTHICMYTHIHAKPSTDIIRVPVAKVSLAHHWRASQAAELCDASLSRANLPRLLSTGIILERGPYPTPRVTLNWRGSANISGH